MTSTETRIIVSAETEAEFDQSCLDCGSTAEWALWVSHGRDMCPAEGYICTPCKEDSERDWIAHLNRGSGCGRCGVTVSGQLSDHLKWIGL